jgi:hypothetical protein
VTGTGTTAGLTSPVQECRKIFAGVGAVEWNLVDKLEGVRVDGGPPAAVLRHRARWRAEELG